MATSPFAQAVAFDYDPGHGLHMISGAFVRPWEFAGWKSESLSWKRGCYIHAGLSGEGARLRYHGPQAAEFLASICTNSMATFRVGRAKHVVMCTSDGLIAAHGILQRLAEDDFRLFASGPWAAFQHSKTAFDVQQTIETPFLFQVAGPKSLDVLNDVSGDDLGDIGFLRFRDTTIAGHRVQVMRAGMAGTLAYELHGPIEAGPEIFRRVVAAGEPHGIQRLGWKTYPVNHVEGGFPQATWTFASAAPEEPGFLDYVSGSQGTRWRDPAVSGSADHADMRARYRTPSEVGWENSVRFDHDFLGRAAVELDLADARRTIVTLEWNPQDIIDIYASLFEEGEEYEYVELPSSPHFRLALAHADRVLVGGRDVGVASGLAYSYWYRKMLSHCTIDRACAEIGTDVTVLWGNPGGRIKEVRARVARFPYLDKDRNQSVQTASDGAR
ncbi:aminomethyl transferase family protein [Maritimibacter harenae]|nr:aminomethyl transferase family protein [Maritimibacter harenae]